MGYMRPVPYTGINSWWTHRHRTIPSKEPGTDYYCPIGTPVHAAGNGVVVAAGDSILYPTGRWYAVDLDDGRSYRDMHLTRRLVKVGDRVKRGQVVAISGASGYGVEDWSHDPATGGSHVHRSLFQHKWSIASQRIGNTLDPEVYSDETPSKESTAGAGSTPLPKPPAPTPEEDDMFTDEDRAKLEQLWNDRAPSGGVQIYERIDTPSSEFMVVDCTLGPVPGTSPLQDGYMVIPEADVRVWARQYSGADKVPLHVTRDDYVAAQEWARKRAARWRADQGAIVKAALKAAG